MTIARRNLVDLEATPYYHCTNRCVRGAFLCGEDERTGRNYEHRKKWIIERLTFLGALFAVDICAYAVMSTHLHVVLRVMAHIAQRWSDEEVLRRATIVCPSTVKDIDKWPLSKKNFFIKEWRDRLSSLSWFMRQLDEHIAKEANTEDGCLGHFWAGRFKSRALLDEGALLTCMAYVDLNPVRAGLAEGLDDSDWTSIQQRIREVATSLAKRRARGQTGGGGRQKSDRLPTSVTQALARAQETASAVSDDSSQTWHRPRLASMFDDAGAEDETIPMTTMQYIELLEWTGRQARSDKKGRITGPPTALLSSLRLDADEWLESVKQFGSLGGFVGHPSRLRERANLLGQRWVKGQNGSTVPFLSFASAA